MALDKTKLSDGTTVEDISRLMENNLTSYMVAETMIIPTVFPAKHENGTLKNGTYVLGKLAEGTVVTQGAITVNTASDQPIRVDVGIVGKPKLFVDQGQLDAATGTVTIKSDCNFVATYTTPVIMTVTGVDPNTEPAPAYATVSLLGMKTGHKTYLPS